MTVSILGTEYEIIVDVQTEEMPEDSDGCVDQTIRKIKIAEFESDKDSVKDMDEYRKKVMRHEIVHAYLYESGLWNNSGNVTAWARCEEIVDWIAIQSPKIFKTFQEADCL